MADSFNITTDIIGYGRLNNQLVAMAGFASKEADDVMGEHVTGEAARLRNEPYAPMLPGQKYVRTYRFGQAFKSEHVKTLHWQVTNRVKSLKYGRPYAVWVAKRGMQARIHQGRWWTADEKLEENLPKLSEALADKSEQLLQRQRD